MFGDVAKQLIHLMGHSRTVPGALLAKEIPAALSQLQAALAHHKISSSSKGSEENENEMEISLAHRAIPLIAMLKAAKEEECNVMWEIY